MREFNSARVLRALVPLVGFLIVGAGDALALSIMPTVDGGVRDGLGPAKDGIPDSVIKGSIVQALDVPNFEDRGIIEFDVSRVSTLSGASLKLNVFASNGPFPFLVDVFVYAGDGSLTLSDFDEGTLLTSFEFAGESSVELDVTSFIDSLVMSGDGFAGFNFQFSIPSDINSNGPFVAFNSLEFPEAASLTVSVEKPVPAGGVVSTLVGAVGLLLSWFIVRGRLPSS